MTSDGENDDNRSPPTQTSTVRQRPPGVPPAPPGTGAAAGGGGPIAYRMGLLRAHLNAARAIYGQAIAGRMADVIVVIADVEDARTQPFTRDTLFDNGFQQPVKPVRAAGGAIAILPATRARAKEALRGLSDDAAETVETRREGWSLVVVAGGGGFTFTLVPLCPEDSGRGM
jgi:hypothetical protein